MNYINLASEGQCNLLLPMLTRHGLVAGATGSGKTVTLQSFVEQLSEHGIPCLVSDVKGDISGLAESAEGGASPFPVHFYDVFDVNGAPVHTTLDDVGPLFLSHLMGLTEVQSACLHMIFQFAKDNGTKISTMEMLRNTISWASNNKEALAAYGAMNTVSLGTLLRATFILQTESANVFFGNENYDINKWMECVDGKGVINILDSVELYKSPTMYGTVLAWILTKLYQDLPEVGQIDKPKFVILLDEAHLLFRDASKPVLRAIESAIRLIRSKGVGVYLFTQSPKDIPDIIQAQLGNRIQHALRGYTVAERTAIKAVADAFCSSPGQDVMKQITSLSVGKAVVSTLQEDGSPSFAKTVKIKKPVTKLGVCSMGVRAECLAEQDKVFPTPFPAPVPAKTTQAQGDKLAWMTQSQPQGKSKTPSVSGQCFSIFTSLVDAAYILAVMAVILVLLDWLSIFD